jgi:hypothetical protein
MVEDLTYTRLAEMARNLGAPAVLQLVNNLGVRLCAEFEEIADYVWGSEVGRADDPDHAPHDDDVTAEVVMNDKTEDHPATTH